MIKKVDITIEFEHQGQAAGRFSVRKSVTNHTVEAMFVPQRVACDLDKLQEFIHREIVSVLSERFQVNTETEKGESTLGGVVVEATETHLVTDRREVDPVLKIMIVQTSQHRWLEFRFNPFGEFGLYEFAETVADSINFTLKM